MNIEKVIADLTESAKVFSEEADDINNGDLSKYVLARLDYIDSVDSWSNNWNTKTFRVVSRNGRRDRKTRKHTGDIIWCFTVKVVFEKFTAGGFHVTLTTEL